MMQQQALFATDKPKSSAEMQRERQFNLARSEQVKAETLAIFRAHQGEWIWSNSELQAIKDKYRIGAHFAATKDALVREGLLESRNVYHGATSPIGAANDLAGSRRLKKGEKPALPYLGYRVEFRFKGKS